MFRVKLSQRFKDLVGKVRARIDKHIENNVRDTVMDIHSTIHEVTPVWSGRTVANFQWGNSPFQGSIEPVSDGDKGEARRSANQSISDSSLQGLDYRSKIYLVNNARYPDGSSYVDMEWGRLPTPSTSRVPPQGIIRLAFAKHPSKKIVSPSRI
jgi:hypothetical protein